MLNTIGLLATAVLGAALTTSVGGPAPTAQPSQDTAATAFKEKLRGELREVVGRSAAEQLIPITIVMKDQVSRAQVQRLAAADFKADRRAAVASLLKRVARQSTRDVLEVLKARQSDGAVGPRLKSLWMRNVIATDATPQTIIELSERTDVAYINYDRPLGKELFPVEPILGGDGSVLAGKEIECGVEIMRAPEVWSEFGITGKGAVVGVIDTGCCWEHPDLINQVWNNPGEIPGDGIDNDANGYIDDIVGWNFRDDTNDPFDDWGHGTHVAGTVGGDGTQGTQTGMAPDVSLMILKYWNHLSGESVAWEAIQYGVDNDADVITGSFGWSHGWDPDRTTWREIGENAIAAGVVMNFAAGNESTWYDPIDNVRTPGDVPDIITVGGTDCDDDDYSSSSRGPVSWEDVPPWYDWAYPPGKMKPTIAAPSVDTISTDYDCISYSVKTGTSMGTPHVAGAIALILEANPSLDHMAVKNILMETAVDLGDPGIDRVFGAGRVDVYEAVVMALSTACPEDITGDGVVDVLDLLEVLGQWGGSGSADITGDGVVDVLDLLEVLGAWGPCP